MKESTGAAILMGLATVILLIFIIMAAFFINYGNTFKIKNSVINHIEQSEGVSESYLQELNASNTEIGVCYKKITSGTDVVGFTVNVVAYMTFDKSILGDTLAFKIPIRGETRIIEKGNFLYQLNSGEYASTINGVSECS